jgi:hypothetical protein
MPRTMRFTKHVFVGFGAFALGMVSFSAVRAQADQAAGVMRVLGGVENLQAGWVKVEFGPEDRSTLEKMAEFLRFQHEMTCSVGATGDTVCGFFLDQNGDARNALPASETVDTSIVLSTSRFQVAETADGLLAVTFTNGLIRNRFSGKDVSCTVESCGFTLSPYGTVDPL